MFASKDLFHPHWVSSSQMDEARRRDKLDDSLLFVMGSVGILFGLFQVFLRPTTLLQFIIPVGLLAWVLPFYYGHIRGAVGDSIADRYRGWIFLVLGSGLYAVIVAEEEVARYLSLNWNQEWIVTVPGLGLLLVLFWQTKRLRRFTLGPAFPQNPVLARSAINALKVAFVITVAGAFLAIVSFLSIWDMAIVGPLTPLALFYMWRSNYYAKRIHWPYAPAHRKGRLQRFGKIRRVYRILSSLAFAIFLVAGAFAVFLDFNVKLTILPQSLLTLLLLALGVTASLAIPALILGRLTRTVEDFDFDGPFPEKPQVNHPI
jgi:hypothetical protein